MFRRVQGPEDALRAWQASLGYNGGVYSCRTAAGQRSAARRDAKAHRPVLGRHGAAAALPMLLASPIPTATLTKRFRRGVRAVAYTTTTVLVGQWINPAHAAIPAFPQPRVRLPGRRLHQCVHAKAIAKEAISKRRLRRGVLVQHAAGRGPCPRRPEIDGQVKHPLGGQPGCRKRGEVQHQPHIQPRARRGRGRGGGDRLRRRQLAA
eukprot:scaffold3082_cov119-Isochrysis_galbana.AAC.9